MMKYLTSMRDATHSLRLIFFLIGIYSHHPTSAQCLSPFECDTTTTTTYLQCIQYYKKLASEYPNVRLFEEGPSDVSYPIHTVVLSTDNAYTPEACQQQNKIVLLINNGIHAGEPDGIDASMIFARQVVSKPEYRKWLEKITIVILPIYNIGGSLQRNSHTRLNQNGPKEFGFRGNAQNLDLNRDFIKCDSKNAKTFNVLFQKWKPHLFIDTHTTDGADYPYALTLISNELTKLDAPMKEFYGTEFLPKLYNRMSSAGVEMFPYIDTESTPFNGIISFIDYPRYSSGYGQLFGTFCVMTESHMLKPHSQRVRAQVEFMVQFTKLAFDQHESILHTKRHSDVVRKQQKEWVLEWAINKEKCDSLLYSGYSIDTLESRIGNYLRIKYDPTRPQTQQIAYYNCYEKKNVVQSPSAYIIPYCYEEVIQRLQHNGIQMYPILEDTVINVGYYKILDYKTSETIYENHYVHSDINVQHLKGKKMFNKGDVIVPSRQDGIAYIIQTLEPQAPDSFFAWNFFDGILNHKEYFSDYIFEDLAEKWIQAFPELKKELALESLRDDNFLKSKEKVLNFIYAKMNLKEPYYMIYPIARVED